ncbi:MAG: VTT domain-containing protein [Alphaproteobacteria bacterium]|nr:VTT domain-containing protein [Alphaproteobacteria bacterium]
MALRAMRKGTIWRALVLAAGLVAAALLVRLARDAGLLDTGWVDGWVRGQGWQGRLVFLAVTAASTGIGVPRQALALLGGYAFGVVEGVALALLGTLIGAAGAFGYARWAARAALSARYGRRLARADRFLAENPFTAVLIVRLLPVGANVVTNVLAGLSAMPLLPFLAGSALGYVPQTVVFALLGKGVRVDGYVQLGLAAALFLASTVLAYALYRRNRQAAAVAEEAENGEPAPAPPHDGPG